MAHLLDIKPLTDAAESAGKVLLEYFNKAATITEKTNAKSIVTQADTAAEKVILDKLETFFPDFNIYAEESGSVDKRSDYTIIIDPLDGTSNFVMGIPLFTVSIAIIDANNESVAGVVHHPILRHTYWAEKGTGAFLDNKPISVNDSRDIAKATVSYGCGYDSPADYGIRLTERATAMHLKRLMSNWSPAYEFCLLASGKIEAIISNGLDLEDYVAGKVILREAGGIITDFDGQPLGDDRQNVFIASNNTDLHTKLVQLAK